MHDDRAIDRRHFIGTCLATAAGLGTLSCERRVSDRQVGYDAKGLPTRVLGKTGWETVDPVIKDPKTIYK